MARLLQIALALFLLALLGALLAPAPLARSAAQAPPSRGREPLTRPITGFTLNLHHTTQLNLYTQAIDDMATLGANTVQVITPAFQTNGAAEQVRVIEGPGHGPDRHQILTLLHYARARGLTTVLMPIVLLTEPRGNEWRGKIQPEHWEPWWESYQAMLDHFLALANEADVDIFCVGSELLTTEMQVDRWRQTIERIRSRFSGRLVYSTNWDTYDKAGFWEHLDVIGVNGYWDLTRGSDAGQPRDQQLVERWTVIREKLLAFAAEQRKPLLLTEVGYPCLPWGLKDPWNYVADSRQQADPQVQLSGYRAFLAAWDGLLGRAPDTNRFAGVLFYKWDPYYSGGPNDTGYGIRGKPTYDLLKHWFARAAAEPDAGVAGDASPVSSPPLSPPASQTPSLSPPTDPTTVGDVTSPTER